MKQGGLLFPKTPVKRKSMASVLCSETRKGVATYAEQQKISIDTMFSSVLQIKIGQNVMA